MAVEVRDINKKTIMDMLRTDVFGFSPEDIENKAKEAYNLVVNGDNGSSSNLKFIGGYGRNESGYIVLFKNDNISSKSKKK